MFQPFLMRQLIGVQEFTFTSNDIKAILRGGFFISYKPPFLNVLG